MTTVDYVYRDRDAYARTVRKAAKTGGEIISKNDRARR